MVDAALRLKNARADFIIICANTMHRMAGDIESRAGIKVLHIAEVTGEKIIEKGMTKVGLLGTRYTMEGDFYKKILNEKYSIDVVIPDEAAREAVHGIIYDELCKGIISEASREKYKKIIDKLIINGAQGIVLGCTEIPLLIKQEDVKVPIFDTTAIHAVSAVEFAFDSI